MKLKPAYGASFRLASSIAVLLLAQRAHAVDKFWEGNSGGTWNSSANWTASSTTINVATSIPGASDDAYFHITGTLGGSGTSMTLAGNQAARAIVFRTAINFSIGSNSGTNTGTKSLTIGEGGITKNTGSGTLSINGNSSGTVSVVVGANQTWTNNATTALNIGTGFSTGTNTAATFGLGDKTLTLAGDGDFNFGTATTSNSVIGISTGSILEKGGSGKLSIGGVNAFAGTTRISGGTLALLRNEAIANSPTIIVGASTTFDVSGVSGGYSLGAGQTLTGVGTVTGAMTVAGTLSPGSSPGIMTTGSQTWVNGADYNFQMLDATAAAGTGFDQIQITGTLDLSGLTSGGFGINLWSLASIGPDVDGTALNFNNTVDQSWTILTTTGGITGFDAADFVVNVGANNGTAGFQNALGGGTFILTATANDLVLSFTAVPEPSAVLLGGLGMLALLRRRR